MPPEKPIPFEGVLNCWNDEHDLPDLLLAISRSGKTGRLLFSNAEADKTLYVKEGKIVFAESSSDDDALGQYLLRIGRISLHDYTRVSKLVEPGKRFGALLVAEGVLEPKDLVPAVIGQVRGIIQGLFRRTETWYGFKEEELTRKEAITLDMPIAQIILDGVQQVESWRRVSKGIGGNLDCVYSINPATASEWARLKLEPGVSELLEMLGEPVSVAEICTEAHVPDFEACRYLWAFRILGWVEAQTLEDEDAVDAVAGEDPAPSFVENDEVPSEETTMAAALAADMAEAGPSTPPKPIPQRLVETRISAGAKEAATATEPKPASPPATPPVPEPTPRPIPQNLVHTQIAVEPLAKSAKKSAPPQSPVATSPAVGAPRAIPERLAQTQMYSSSPEATNDTVEPTAGEMMEAILDDAPPVAAPPPAPQPRSAPPSNSTQFFPDPSALPPPTTNAKPTVPGPPGPTPRPSKDSTQLFESESAFAPPELPPAAAPNDSTRVFADASALAPPTPAPEPSSSPSNDSTQFFADATALAPEVPAATPDAPPAGDGPSFDIDSYEDFLTTEMSGDFAALSLDYGTPPPVPPETVLEAPTSTEPVLAEPSSSLEPPAPVAPTRLPSLDDAAMASFPDLAISDESIVYAPPETPVDMPMVEATVVEASEAEPSFPVVEGDLVTHESPPEPADPPPPPSGMEIFAMTDPFLVPSAPTTDQASFSTDHDAMEFHEEAVGAALPRRPPRTDDLDMDMDGLGHVFGGDD